MGWMHAKCVVAARNSPNVSAEYAEGKTLAAAYFFRHELGRLDEICGRLSELDETFVPAQAANF